MKHANSGIIKQHLRKVRFGGGAASHRRYMYSIMDPYPVACNVPTT